VGRFLRVSSLDELPQLLNVLAGHMSLVGPRPVTARELAEYEDRVSDYLAVRPGLTGLWQVSGRNLVRFPERADLDSRYRVDCAPWLDLAILVRTPRAVLARQGSE
jgi:lipopolysaccharide/colanic/teichoic acid biosynthesis glycosyltransferase